MILKKSFAVLSGLMLLAAANSVAMSLGRHRGVALIGKPLDIFVQATLDAQEDVIGSCLDADVFYADSKVDKSRVRVTAERSNSGLQEAVIRVRSTSLVDEPVVTVYLRAGCQQKTERRYVMLADLASDVQPDRGFASPFIATTPVMPVVPVAPEATPASGSGRARPPADPTQSIVKRSRKVAKNPGVALNNGVLEPFPGVSPDASGGKKARDNAVLAASPPSGKRARLKLEPLDLSIDRDPQLKSSAQLLSSTTASPEERSSAAALWLALNAQPQDILRDTQRLQTLEKSVVSLQTQSQKTQVSIDALGIKLQKAQSERYANPLVYMLGALLLLALSGLAYLARDRFVSRRESGSDRPWWRKNDPSEPPGQSWDESRSVSDISEIEHSGRSTNNGISPSLKHLPLDIDLAVDFSDAGQRANAVNRFQISKQEADFGSNDEPTLGSKFSPDFSLSMAHSNRTAKAEELFDVQQQADFFVSVGQHDQAIEVLRSHIVEGGETSALVYLDLFNLYHQLKREKDYSGLREEFNVKFNTEIPVFDMYTETAPGLDAYQQAMSRIEALWPSSKVLEVIEESLFRKPDNNAEAFNLVAYRELLLLYSMAKDITSLDQKTAVDAKHVNKPVTSAAAIDSGFPNFSHTSVQPLSASFEVSPKLHPDASTEPLFMSVVPPPSRNLGLDLDLSEPDKPPNKYKLGAPVANNALMTNDSDMMIDFDDFDAADDMN